MSPMFVVVGLCHPQMSLAWLSVQGQLLCEYSNEDSRDSSSPVDNNVLFPMALAACSPLTSAQLSSLGPCTLQDDSAEEETDLDSVQMWDPSSSRACQGACWFPHTSLHQALWIPAQQPHRDPGVQGLLNPFL